MIDEKTRMINKVLTCIHKKSVPNPNSAFDDWEFRISVENLYNVFEEFGWVVFLEAFEAKLQELLDQNLSQIPADERGRNIVATGIVKLASRYRVPDDQLIPAQDAVSESTGFFTEEDFLNFKGQHQLPINLGATTDADTLYTFQVTFKDRDPTKVTFLSSTQERAEMFARYSLSNYVIDTIRVVSTQPYERA